MSMSNVKINNEVELTYPDGFREMREEELTRYFSSSANRWGVYHEDQHLILSVSWTKAGFKRMFTDAESFLFEVEARMCRNLLNYQRIGSYKTKIAKKKAWGVRFEYRVNDARLVQVADLFVFKYKKKFYAIHFISRKSNAAESRAGFETVMKSLKLS